MKEIRVPIEKFNFNKFVDDYIKFAPEVVNTDYAVAIIEKSGDAPEFVDDFEDKKELLNLLNQGKALFFMFSDVNVGQGDIACADGNEVEIDEDSDFNLIGEVDCVGFLISKKNEEFIIKSAIHYGGSFPGSKESIDIETDCDIFEAPMQKYIESFYCGNEE